MQAKFSPGYLKFGKIQCNRALCAWRHAYLSRLCCDLCFGVRFGCDVGILLSFKWWCLHGQLPNLSRSTFKVPTNTARFVEHLPRWLCPFDVTSLAQL
jgi:hypothetical protein